MSAIRFRADSPPVGHLGLLSKLPSAQDGTEGEPAMIAKADGHKTTRDVYAVLAGLRSVRVSGL